MWLPLRHPYDEMLAASSKIVCLYAGTSSFVYHRIRSLTQSVGAMLWSMAQLRRGHLRTVVYVVGSC